MAAETEIERLVVRLIGENDDYLNMLDRSIDATNVAVTIFENAATSVTGLEAALKSVAEVSSEATAATETISESVTDMSDSHKEAEQAVASSMQGITTSHLVAAELIAHAIENVTERLKDMAQETIHAWGEQQEVDVALRAALESQGKNVDELFEKHTKFSELMEQQTVYADETTIAMLKYAESLGVTGDAAQRAVRNAMALVSISGRGSAMSNIRLTAGLEQGNTQGLMRQLPALRAIEDTSARAAKAQDILAKGFKITQAETTTYFGSLKQLDNQISNMREGFGRIVTEGLAPFIKMAGSAAEWVNSLSDTTKKWIVGIGTAVVVVGGLLAAFAAIGAAIGPIMVVITGIGPAIMAGIGGVVSLFTGLGGILAAAFGAILSPVGLIITAVIALGGVAYVLIQRFGGFEAIWNAIKRAAMSFWETVSPIFSLLVEIGTTTFALIADVAMTSFGGIADFATWLWDSVSTDATSAWETVLTVTTNTLQNILGFMSNFRQNIGILWAWIRDNWFNVVKDITNLAIVLAGNLAKNIGVGVVALVRVWIAWQGWLVGMFKRLFSFEILDAVLTGLIKIGETIREWASSAWETIKRVFSRKNPLEGGIVDWGSTAKTLQGDLEKGMKDVNFANTVNDIFNEEKKNFINPLDGFVSTITDAPEFNLSIPIKEGVETVANKAEKPAFNAGASIGKAVGKGMMSQKFDAAEFMSAESITRLQEYADLLKGESSKKGKGKAKHGVDAHAGAGAMTALDINHTVASTSGEAGIGRVVERLNVLIEIQRQNLAKPPVTFNTADIAQCHQ